MERIEEWNRPQKHARPFGVAHLVVGGIMLLCDLLLFLVSVRTAPSLTVCLCSLCSQLRRWYHSCSERACSGRARTLVPPETRNAQQDTRAGVSVPEEEQMHPSGAHRPGKVWELERLLLLFFFLAALSLVGVYVVTPSVYVTKLLLAPSPTDPYPLPVTLFLGSILVFVAVIMVGVIQHWRWVFWLLLVAFGCSILELPATLLQLLGLLPGHPPVWYGLSQMCVALLEVGFAVWMSYISQHYGVWAMGKKRDHTWHLEFHIVVCFRHLTGETIMHRNYTMEKRKSIDNETFG